MTVVPSHLLFQGQGWQPRAAKTAVQRVAGHGPWLRVRPARRIAFEYLFGENACSGFGPGSRARPRPPCSASPRTGPGSGCAQQAGMQ